MNIVFDMMNCGLGDNGGTRTILLCQKTLKAMGHRCVIFAATDNFSWFKHDNVSSSISIDTDVIIATSCNTVSSVFRSKVPKKAWYIRAHESWAMKDHQLRACYNAGLFNIVNSKGLQRRLSSYGADSEVVYQGIDFDLWENRNLRPTNKIRIGCLHTTQPRKRWKDFVELSEILGMEKYEYVGIGNAKPTDTFLTDFKLNANVEELNDLYSSCHIWFAPTENEGLHNVPMEAALCGCLIVCSDHPLNGMIFDYAVKDMTAMVYEFGKIEQAADCIRNPDWSLVEGMWSKLRIDINDREYNMKKLIEWLRSI